MNRIRTGLFVVALAVSSPALAQTAGGVETFEATGTVGPYRIGANLTVRDYRQFVAGHYFYASHLTDIPLTGSSDGENFTFSEANGGVFRLHLVTNSSTTKRPLTFYTSTGLAGTWTDGKVVLPVTLGFETNYDGTGPDRWYEDVTAESDAAFEARVRGFLHGVTSGDCHEAARNVSFPLRVNGAKVQTIRTSAVFCAQWNHIFTPRYVALLRDAIPHEMFVREGEAMVANGAVWFDAKGAKVLNTL